MSSQVSITSNLRGVTRSIDVLMQTRGSNDTDPDMMLLWAHSKLFSGDEAQSIDILNQV
jgi:hypothetical protein